MKLMEEKRNITTSHIVQLSNLNYSEIDKIMFYGDCTTMPTIKRPAVKSAQ